MFFAYPNKPGILEETIESAINKINTKGRHIKSWRALEIMGSFIIDNIENEINKQQVLVADISILNFNVTYEIGYAIGRKIPILLIRNKSLAESRPNIREVGLFDTVGYKEYSNSSELVDILTNPEMHVLIGDINPNNTSPIFLFETKYKTDYATRISARIKKAGFVYRSFDPNEMPRLSAHDAIKNVSQSYGVVVPLLSKESEDFEVHNIRAAFVAGLTFGMDKPLCLLQYDSDPVPIDYRDFVSVYTNVNDINEHIGRFAIEVIEAMQCDRKTKISETTSQLQKIEFGASAAENEMRTLHYYYLKTDAFLKALRGESQLVVGRKGSGKSAIFLQIRDKERSSGDNIVLDLKPDGYKLIKFKEQILNFLEEGTFQHTITAFWEYILLLEICHKILDVDKKRYKIQSDLFAPYVKLEDLFRAEDYLTEGDFVERMTRLMNNITKVYKNKYGEKEKVRLTNPEITDFIYRNDIKKLRSALIDYLKFKDKVWLLFDNIDKGWPSNGLTSEDLTIIRSLVEGARSIQREFAVKKINVFPVIFLRNDVYELLVNKTADKQKEAKAILDWVDPDLLKEMIRLRIASSIECEPHEEAPTEFNDLWRNICVSHYDGEETFQYLVERSLMRPRFLINLLNQCKSVAINLNHSKINTSDIEKGFSLYSVDLLTDISYEIRDVLPEAENILYGFIQSDREMNQEALTTLIRSIINDGNLVEKVVDVLLYYGFLGINSGTSETTYIYSINYNTQLLKGLINKGKSAITYHINPAFWPALMIK
jgi:hypothetical protein